MKTEFIDLSETRKHLVVEVPSAIVDAEIDRLARRYSRSARLPGFRPGKAPTRLVLQRFRDQILHDVAHDLIPRVVDEALRERGVEPVDTPSIQDVTIEAGRPLTFTALFETVPPVDPGDYSRLTVRRLPVTIAESDVDAALESLRARAARFEPIEGRPAAHGDTVVVDLDRRGVNRPAQASQDPLSDRHANVSIELGGAANPPGFDDHLVGLVPGDTRTFSIRFPTDSAVTELAGAEVEYTVTVRALRRRVLPDLDDEFARDVGSFDTLAALGDRVRADLQSQADRDAERQMRGDLSRQLGARLTAEVPDALVTREMDRRVELVVRQLVAQGVDPRRTDIDWTALREDQRGPATDAVRSALVVDEIARREGIQVGEADFARELERYAAETGRTVAAVHAVLEKEGGVGRLVEGLRREKTIDFLVSRATIVPA